MPYIDWFCGETVLSGTSLRDNDRKENNSMNLKDCKDPDAILENRELLMQELHHELANCVFPDQNHTNHIYKVTKDDIGKGAFDHSSAIANCDALYTKERNLLIGVFSADCVPILIYDPTQNIIAAIHAGWRGTMKQITKKMLDVLINEENCNPEDLKCYIGPALDFFSFECEKDVVEQVRNLPIESEKFIIDKGNGKYLVDNKRINMEFMLQAGVLDTNIVMHHGDTMESSEDYFSYRRDKNGERHLTFIMQK